MASLNTKEKKPREKTHEGAKAAKVSSAQELRHSVLACLLWENEFYEEGEVIAERIARLAASRPPEEVAALAIEARNEMHLRHVPLLLLKVLCKTGAGISNERMRELVAARNRALANGESYPWPPVQPHLDLVPSTFERVINRADEMSEFLALYFADGKVPLSKGAQKGLARAFNKFDAYQLGKYKGTGDKVTLRDVMFLAHPKPSEDRVALYKSIAEKTIEAPDTWEVNLSAGKDKKETFTRLLERGNLGYLALLRNLKGMTEAGVDRNLIVTAIHDRKGARQVLPFRFIAALNAAPTYAEALDMSLRDSIAEMPVLEGRTAILVDVSGSMDQPLSKKSDMNRIDAACALATFVRGDKRVFSFSNGVAEIPLFEGLSMIQHIKSSQPHSGTYLGKSIEAVVNHMPKMTRIIVITDEQSADPVGNPPEGVKGYMINVASNKNGIGKKGWTRIDGFSENVLRYVIASEAEGE